MTWRSISARPYLVRCQAQKVCRLRRVLRRFEYFAKIVLRDIVPQGGSFCEPENSLSHIFSHAVAEEVKHSNAVYGLLIPLLLGPGRHRSRRVIGR